MSENKVQFNLKNVHYSVVTETVGTGGAITYTYATPVAVPGAVALSLEPQGDITPFYADGLVFYNAIANNGYSGDLEMARFPDSMMTAIWGMTEGSTSKVLTENANVEPATFALLFEIDGDADEQNYVMYSCKGTRPAISSTTNTDTKEPQTMKSTITSIARQDGKIMARTTADTPSTTVASWYTSVFVEA